jgi:hypothetical protein
MLEITLRRPMEGQQDKGLIDQPDQQDGEQGRGHDGFESAGL